MSTFCFPKGFFPNLSRSSLNDNACVRFVCLLQMFISKDVERPFPIARLDHTACVSVVLAKFYFHAGEV